MPIFKGSRYEEVPVYQYYNDPTDTGYRPNSPSLVPTLRRKKLTEFFRNDAITHIFQKSDRIDLLAHRYYGDSQKWWIILDANPRYMNPWDIPVGTKLIIPPITSFEGGE